MRQILPTREVPHQWPALLRDLITDRSPQRRVTGFECVQNGTLRNSTFHFELHLAGNACKRPKMGREHDSNHGKVWTSTDTTLGRSRTIGAQLSPESVDA